MPALFRMVNEEVQIICPFAFIFAMAVFDAENMKKDKDFIVHTIEPMNSEPPLHAIQENFITPNDLFYKRNHGPVPEIDLKTFRLKVNGMVDHALELSYDVLRNDFSKQTVTATLQCAGNRRDQLIEVAPVPGEVPWQSGAIGNAVWSGVPLREILIAAGVQPDAEYVAFMGAEEVIRYGKNVGFGASIPIEKAMSNEVLVAYEMNGKTLEPLHGFPLRMVVPGYIGARSVKWLTEITLQKTPSKNYFQDHAYRLFPPQANAETVDWDTGLQLGELSVNCVITAPQNNDVITQKYVTVEGYAMSGGGRKIVRIDISTDNGETWINGSITRNDEKWAWAFWEAQLNLNAGIHEIIARAIDSASNTQPENVRHVWNFKGYMNNAWHRIRINVQ